MSKHKHKPRFVLHFTISTSSLLYGPSQVFFYEVFRLAILKFLQLGERITCCSEGSGSSKLLTFLLLLVFCIP